MMKVAAKREDERMPWYADRRTFLATSAQALVGTVACTHFGCRRDNAPPDASQRIGFDQLVMDLEQRIPKTLRDNAVPGCSIVLVRKGEVAWSRGFGVADVVSGVP